MLDIIKGLNITLSAKYNKGSKPSITLAGDKILDAIKGLKLPMVPLRGNMLDTKKGLHITFYASCKIQK